MTVSPINNINNLLGGLPVDEAPKARNPQAGFFDKDMFLKLLVAQLKYQNPAKPTDQAEFMNQAATLANVEQMQAMADQVATSASWQRALAASALVGKQVTGVSSTGASVTGIVERAALGATSASVIVNGESVPLSSVTEVEMPSSTQP